MNTSKRTAKKQPESGVVKSINALESYPKLLAFIFVLWFVGILLVLAVWFPQPTAFQYTVFRITLALAAAGVAGAIPGMIRLKVQPGKALLIHAGGALAVFVIVYLIAPAALPSEERPAKKKAAAVQVHQLIQGNNNTAINLEKGNMEVTHEK